jgi:hypothetical protein
MILLKNLHFLFCWLWKNELSKHVHVHAGPEKQRREFRDAVSYWYRHCYRRNVIGKFVLLHYMFICIYICVMIQIYVSLYRDCLMIQIYVSLYWDSVMIQIYVSLYRDCVMIQIYVSLYRDYEYWAYFVDPMLERRHCSPSSVSVAFEITYVSGPRIFITVQFLLRREGVKHVYVFLLVDSVNSCLPMLPNICNTWREDVGDTVIQTVGEIERASEWRNISLSKQST